MSDDRRHKQEREDRPLAELISAYLDDRESLSSTDLEHVERLLDDDRDAQQLYRELRVITQGLAELDAIPAPRSYHLDAEMVGAPEPVAMKATSAWYVRHAASVRWATAAAAVLFVFVLGADLVLNNVFRDPVGENDAFNSSQSELSSRQADDSDDSGGAGADLDQPEAVEESGDADSGGGEEAPPVVTPEVAGDSDDAVEDIPDSAALSAPETEEDQGADGAVAVTESAADDEAVDESAANDQMLAFDQEQSEPEDGTSDRRLWRIAEFSLVVLLGALITVMVILPRLRGSPTRASSD